MSTHCLVAQSDDVRDGAGSTVLHDNPQVCVLEVAAIVLHYVRAGRKCQTVWLGKEKFGRKHCRSEKTLVGQDIREPLT